MGISKDKLIEAIHQAGGVLSLAAMAAGCSLRTMYNYRNNHEDIAQAINEAREAFDGELLDTGESKLLAAVKAGQPWAIKFVLSTKGRERGYTEKLQVDHSGEIKQITMVMDIAPRLTDSDYDADASTT